MKSLMYKDIILIKKKPGMLLIGIILSCVFGAASVYSTGGNDARTFIIQNIFFMWSLLWSVYIMVVMPMMYEKLLNMDNFIKSTGKGLIDVIISKYIVGIIIFVLTTIVGKTAGIIFMNISGRGNLVNIGVDVIKYGFMVYMVFLIMTITINYCFTRNKIRYVNLIIYLTIIVGPSFLMGKITKLSEIQINKMTDLFMNNGRYIEITIFGSIGILVILSIMISSRVGQYIEG